MTLSALHSPEAAAACLEPPNVQRRHRSHTGGRYAGRRFQRKRVIQGMGVVVGNWLPKQVLW